MPTLCIKGKISTGKGEGAQFVKLPWVRKQIIQKLGFTPFPGTLNIRLTEDG
ncbi:riboflavin kinase, partial [Candidatus Bathyarchaeota archaeon CG07_land_8_20_14_0_80_47_9]